MSTWSPIFKKTVLPLKDWKYGYGESMDNSDKFSGDNHSAELFTILSRRPLLSESKHLQHFNVIEVSRAQESITSK